MPSGSSIQLYSVSQWLFLRPLRRLLCAAIDRFLSSFQDVEGSLKWTKELGGGLVPTGPAEGLPLTVKSGKLPSDLAGAYMRVGPNAQHWPPKRRTHVFDSDGMVHSIRVAGGKAVYHCQYMETPRHVFERKWGMEWFPRIGEMSGKAGLAKILTTMPAKKRLSGVPDAEQGAANTAIDFTPDGKLWALNEAGSPFRFRLDEAGVPRSIGFDDLGGTLKCKVSAHPKFDRRTQETFFHGRELMKEFYMGRIANGRLTDRVNLDVKSGFHHDMFITEDYAVIVDGSLSFNPKSVVKGGALWTLDPGVKLRFGIYPRAAGKMTADAFTWIESDLAADIVHTLYAYNEGETIVLWSPMTQYVEMDAYGNTGILGNVGPNHLRRIVIDVAKKSVKIQEVPGAEKYETEFPRIRDDRVGMRVRYGYTAIQRTSNGEPEFNMTGILKWDFQECKLVGAIHFPEGVVGGEVVFCPPVGPNGAAKDCVFGDDDRGYLSLIQWNPQTRESTFAAYDAKTFSPQPVVELSIPQRVPIGFHAKWITEEQFQQQLLTV